MNEEGLYSILDLVRSSKTSVVHAPGHEAERGESLFHSFVPQLRKRLCDEWKFCERRHDSDLMDTVNLIAGVADVIAGLTIGFPPVIFATILVKKGLASFCSC